MLSRQLSQIMYVKELLKIEMFQIQKQYILV